MTSFKQTYTQNFAQVSTYSGTDDHYWKKYEFPVSVKEFSSINSIDVSQVEPFYIAVTTGPKVDLYHQQTAQVWRSLTRFQKEAYGGRFRKDGQLLLAGSEEAQVKLFNFRQNQLLRIFKGHTGPVHRSDFICSKPQVVSFSDDKTISLWDVSDEKELVKFIEHKDFVRAGVASPTSEHIVISGSYDHTVKVWDARTGSSVMTFTHGTPVESVICYPSGSVIASAGGTEVKVWDPVGGKLLTVLSQHHKTITCLAMASNNTRLLSGSLDRHIKVYDVVTYSTLHSMDYPAPILSLAVAPRDSTLITGMLSGGSGLVSFQQRSVSAKTKASEWRKSGKKHGRMKPRPGDEIVTFMETKKLTGYNKFLCRFEYARALDDVIDQKIPSHVTVAVLRELIRRSGLATALSGRDARSLTQIIRFFVKNIQNPTFKDILIIVVNTLLDIYGDAIGENRRLLNQFSRLNDELEMDLRISKSGVGLMGAIEMLLATSDIPEIQSGNRLATPATYSMKLTASNNNSSSSPVVWEESAKKKVFVNDSRHK